MALFRSSSFAGFLLVLAILVPFMDFSAREKDSKQPQDSETPNGILFRWKLEKNDVLELNEFHNVLFRVSGQSIRRQDKTRIALRVDECQAKSCRIHGRFDTYTRYGNLRGPFRRDKTYRSDFFIQPNGTYVVPDEFAVPNLRSLPAFPDKPLNPGDTWSMPAEESFDFDSGRFKIGVQAEYTSLGASEWKWEEYSGRGEKIHYSYPLFYQNSRPAKGLPSKVYGLARGTIYFDPIRGVPQFKENRLSYTFVYPDGRVTEANFHIHGVYAHRKSLSDVAKNELRDSIRKDLGLPIRENSDLSPDEEPIQVRKTKEGISISMDSVLFDTDKYNLKPKAKSKLGDIAKVLKKYPEREVRISGHTDNRGDSQYNQKLSENRAKSVLDEFVKENGIPSNRLSYQGFGDTKPISSNNTEEGRQKNRRVDITIVVE